MSSERHRMRRRQREAVLVALEAKLRAEGSWGGETHLQKATYFAQEMTRVPMDFDFILYKYGPFSPDLRDELSSMRADGFLVMRPVPGYGPQLEPTDRAHAQLVTRWPRTLARHDPRLTF